MIGKVDAKRLLMLSILALCLVAMPLFAAADPDPEEVESMDIAITKVLSMPEDTDVPHATFEFEWEPYAYNDSTTQTAMTLPDLNDASNLDISFGSTDPTVTVGGRIDITKYSETLLDGVTFDRPGYYSYKVWETDETYACGPLETMVYDSRVWIVTFTVDWVPGLAEATFVSAIDIQELIAEGTGDEPDVLGEKLDELVFENFYVMTHDNLDPEIETEGLNVSKVTTGMLAEYDLYFEYAVWIKAPDAVNEAALRASDGVDGFAGYYAYVLDTKDGETTTTVDNGPTFVTTPGDYEGALFFSNETTTTVFLKHSQTLVFVGTHVGTQWAVTEVDPFDYIPEYVLTRGGVAGSVVQGEQGEALATGKQQLIQGVNAADYVNFLPHTPRTGLLIGMLHPLMLTAIVLLIVLMLVESYKNRRAKELVPVSVY